MPTNGPPADQRCDCGGCREFRAVHDHLCRELPIGERLAKRAADRAEQRRYEDLAAEHADRIRRAG